jgi:hypothetical protein
MLKIDYKNTTTYEMNAFVGFPIVEYSTKWLTENGYLTPTKCYFINNELEYENENMQTDMIDVLCKTIKGTI